MMEIDEDELRDALDLDDCLSGITIVCSGEFESVSRSKIEEFIASKGGRCTSAVSGKTNYLVVGFKLEDGRSVD
jgi:replication factor C subunit 1